MKLLSEAKGVQVKHGGCRCSMEGADWDNGGLQVLIWGSGMGGAGQAWGVQLGYQ